MLEVDKLCVSMNEKTLLDNISFKAENNEFLGIIGVNGAGKTTLLKALAGLLPFSGNVILQGKMNYLPQDFSSWVDLRVEEAVALGQLFPDTAPNNAMIEQALQAFSLHDMRSKRLSTLSGGERGRVALARLFARPCELYLLDEPLNHFDPAQSVKTLDFLQKAQGLKIAVFHDLALASRFCTRLLLLHKGELRVLDTPYNVLASGAMREAYGAFELIDFKAYALPFFLAEA